MSGIQFDKVTKRFHETVAVNDLSIEIADGEFMIFVGPSGCGKTTALAAGRGPRGGDRRDDPARRRAS